MEPVVLQLLSTGADYKRFTVVLINETKQSRSRKSKK